MAEGDFVLFMAAFRDLVIAADIVRLKDGVLAEHWDVIQDEATKAKIKKRATHVWRHLQ